MRLRFKNNEVYVTSSYQWHVYTGLIEGLPFDKMNERIIEEVLDRGVKLTYIDKHYLIEPKQTPIQIGREYPFGQPIRLPPFACVFGLRHDETSNPKIGGISMLTLIFFQDSVAPPVDKEILEKVRDLDWFSLAEDIPWEDF